MPIGWFSVLKNIPWSEVIKNAPKVVDGAKTLWSTVGKKPSTMATDSKPESSASSSLQSIAAIEDRTAALETAVSNLQVQMLESTKLVKELADQNEQLVQRIEANRVSMLQLTGVLIVVAIVALIGLFMAISRHGA